LTAEVSSGRFLFEDTWVKVALRPKALRSKAARRDSAVHVSLSSDSLVKQPGTVTVPPPGKPESRRSPTLPMKIGSLVTEYQ
jgi:hypothetical protein